MIEINGIQVHGLKLDRNTRCKHYNSEVDVIAIRMKCCNKYYACNSCHNELELHEINPWTQSEFNEKAILCGKCGKELTISEYLSSNSRCPNCDANFNPNCSKHYPIYFCL
ncbi:MAG: CHY zinc finger protein [Bacteroidales bacterium]|nr:CHY zinc finger protein [Bacteroidales bacterium]